MSLSTNVTNLATRIASESKALRTLVNGNAADLSALSTVAKSNLVAAINELYAAISSASGINDSTTSTTTSWSSSKTDAEINAAVAALVDSSPAALDTLNEIAAALGDDPNFATTITTALGNRVRVDAAQSLTGPQQAQARTNIGAGTPYTLPAATETVVGGAEIATTAEVTAGLDDSRILTAAKLAARLTTVLTGYAAASHTHTASQISDATTTGRAVMMAATALAARTAIGAGTSSLAIGTGAGTAADAAAVGDTNANFVTTFESGLI